MIYFVTFARHGFSKALIKVMVALEPGADSHTGMELLSVPIVFGSNPEHALSVTVAPAAVSHFVTSGQKGISSFLRDFAQIAESAKVKIFDNDAELSYPSYNG
jgi:hypothetical protein